MKLSGGLIRLFSKIPKIMNFYWEGENFSYLHYLSIKSFIDLNADWECRVHTPSVRSTSVIPWPTKEQKTLYSGENYFGKLKDLNLTIHKVEMDPKYDELHPVHRSDFFRWNLLATSGGAWSDCDILYVNSLDAILRSEVHPAIGNLSLIEKEDVDTVMSHYSLMQEGGAYIAEIYPIGFFMASSHNKFFTSILKEANHKLDLINSKRGATEFHQSIHGHLLNYQTFGAELLQSLFPKSTSIRSNFSECINIGRLPFYFVQCFELEKLFGVHDFTSNKISIPPHIVGIHWFNGAKEAVEFSNTFNEDSMGETPNCFLHSIIKEYLK